MKARHGCYRRSGGGNVYLLSMTSTVKDRIVRKGGDGETTTAIEHQPLIAKDSVEM